MPDINLFPDMVQHAPAVKPIVKHVIVHAKPVIHTIQTGYSMLTLFLTSVGSLVAGFGTGYYVKSRGMTGIKADLATVKTDVANLQNMVRGVAPAPTPAA